jgi:hypothetical protein
MKIKIKKVSGVLLPSIEQEGRPSDSDIYSRTVAGLMEN